MNVATSGIIKLRCVQRKNGAQYLVNFDRDRIISTLNTCGTGRAEWTQRQLYIITALLRVSWLGVSADPQVLNEQNYAKPWMEVWCGWAGKERGLYEVQLGHAKIGRSYELISEFKEFKNYEVTTREEKTENHKKENSIARVVLMCVNEVLVWTWVTNYAVCLCGCVLCASLNSVRFATNDFCFHKTGFTQTYWEVCHPCSHKHTIHLCSHNFCYP